MIDNRLQFTDAVTKAEFITTTNHGLEKIEPLGLYYSHDDIINKLNKVIEAVNKMMEVMNRRVK